MPAQRDRIRADGLSRLFEVPPLLEPFAPAALVRLTYLHPDADFQLEEGAFWISAKTAPADYTMFRTEAAHALYRERIYQESLPLRRSIYTKIFGQ